MKRTLQFFLEKYYEIQDQILVCYRPTEDNSWSDRCLYLSENYDDNKPYNHRSILKNEIVIEFDDKNKESNLQNALEVAKRLRADGFKIAMWFSGNKSTHLHTFVDMGQCSNPRLMKNIFIRHYSEGLPVPDLQLCADNHLIRAECGVHERTGEKKEFIEMDKEYPKLKKISSALWDRYTNAMQTVTQRRISTDLNSLESLRGFQFILTTDEFRKSDDGRERALFMLIHVLKKKYENRQADLIKYLQDWYRYSSGRKMTDRDIELKVKSHWNRSYTPGRTYLNELLESLGRSDLIDK